jgi:succinate dehydrogenase / fumarate reductase flavoprotein subunit
MDAAACIGCGACVAAWEFAGDDKPPVLNKEPLAFENVKLSQRSYK